MRGRRPVPLKERFDDKWMPEPNSGCWLWLAAVRRRGYGIVTLADGSNGVAHRTSWELYRGPVPARLWVLHKCDNPWCVNPDHLFVGTPQNNVDDMLAKGRARPARGAAHWQTHLTDSDVLAIRASNDKGGALAEQFGVSQGSISEIRNLKRWRHI